MTDDIAARVPRSGWLAVGGRVMPPPDGLDAQDAGLVVAVKRRELTGRVSFASCDGLLGPARRLRFRRARSARQAVAWLLAILLAPSVTRWVWGMVSGGVH